MGDEERGVGLAGEDGGDGDGGHGVECSWAVSVDEWYIV